MLMSGSGSLSTKKRQLSIYVIGGLLFVVAGIVYTVISFMQFSELTPPDRPDWQESQPDFDACARHRPQSGGPWRGTHAVIISRDDQSEPMRDQNFCLP